MADARGVTRELERLMERTVRRLTLRIYQAVTIANPVDTGFSRGSWRVTNSPPDLEGIKRPVVREIAESQGATLFSQHNQAAQALAGGYKLRQGQVFIWNPVFYVVFLNQGSSAQAPKRFIDRAIAKAVRATQAEVR